MDSHRPADDDAQRLAELVSETMGAADRAAQHLGIVLEEVRPGYARMRMLVEARMLNGHDLCHGGMIFTLADTAFAHACNSRNEVTVASGAEIAFLSPAREGEVLVAVASERARTGRTGIYDVEVHDRASGRMVALFRGRSHKTKASVVPGAGSSNGEAR